MSETQGETPLGSGRELKITLPLFLYKWIQRVPKSLLLYFLLFLLIGIGIGIGVGALHAVSYKAIAWFQSRPIPPKKWPVREFPPVGIEAVLRTEWNDGSHCRLIIEPISQLKQDNFREFLSKNQEKHITINLYNSTGFQIWNEDEYISNFISMNNDVGKVYGAMLDGCLSYIPHDLYSKAVSWNFSTNLPYLTSSSSTASTVAPKDNSQTLEKRDSKSARKGESTIGSVSHIALSGDDFVSGYSYGNNDIETSGGLTFFIYKDGERVNALMWETDSARIHYQCDKNLLCALTRADSNIVLHAQLRR